MSFTFEWPRFSEQFHTDAIQMLNNALNKGDKPPVIADKIEVVELEMGTQVRLRIVCLAHAIHHLVASRTRDSGHWRTHRRPVSRNI